MANVLEIVIKATNMTGQGLQAAQGSLEGFAGKISSALSGMGLMMAADQLTKFGDAIQRVAKDIIDTSSTYILQVEEMARITGASAEETSRLIQVADDQRVSVGELTTAVRIYSMRMAQAGQSTTVTIDTIAALSDEYIKLAPGTERNAYLMEKFGRSGLSMARMMEQGSEALREQSKAVDESLIITKEAIQAQRDYEMALDDLDDALTGIKTELGIALMPVLTELVGILNNTVIPAVKYLAELFSGLPKPVQGVIVSFGLLVIAAGNVAPALISMAGMLKILIGAEGFAGVAMAAKGAATAVGGLGWAGLGPIALLVAAVGLLIWVYNKMGAEASIAAQQLLYITAYFCDQAATAIENAFMKILNDTTVFFFNLLLAASTSATQLTLIWEAMMQQAIWWADGIVTATEDAVTGIVKKLRDMWNSILDTAKAIAQSAFDWFKTVGQSIVDGIWAGIQGGWDWLVEQVKALAQSLLDAAMAAIQGGSPARLFIPVGESITEGIGAGIIKGRGALQGTLANALANYSTRDIGGEGLYNSISWRPTAGIQSGAMPAVIDVRRVEFHGSFSDREVKRLMRNSRRMTQNVLLEALGG